jgi:hypothetical protein
MKLQQRIKAHLLRTYQLRRQRQTRVEVKMIHLQIRLKAILINQKKNQKLKSKLKKKRS